jgi:hypothetical protein
LSSSFFSLQKHLALLFHVTCLITKETFPCFHHYPKFPALLLHVPHLIAEKTLPGDHFSRNFTFPSSQYKKHAVFLLENSFSFHKKISLFISPFSHDFPQISLFPRLIRVAHNL